MRLISRAPPDADITLVMGARTRPEVLFMDAARALLRPYPHRVVACTDDGSYGRPGLATDAAADELSGGAFDAVYACGPEIMMHKTMRLAHDAGVFAQASVERIMKCGTGICGSCCMGHELVCGDGTVFEAGRLLANPDFGVRYRTKSGGVAYY